MTPAEAARAYARRGWRLFPCHSMRGSHCSCRNPECQSPGKHPRTQNGVKAASAYLGDVVRWWAEWPDANVAIATGSDSGLVALDIDPRHGGFESLESMEGEHGELAATVISLTGGGGLHFLFKHPGRQVPNRRDLAGYSGIDLKGDDGYVIGPPSNHTSGGVYAWNPKLHPDKVGIAPLPAFVLELALRKRDVEPVGYKRKAKHLSLSPGDRLGFWLEHDERVKARFNRDAAGLVDSSASGIEFSLAAMLAARGFDGSEIEIAIASSRERAGLPPRRACYYRSTVGKALAGASR